MIFDVKLFLAKSPPSIYLTHLLTVGHSQLTVMSTVWTSVSMSLTAVHWYFPALCLLIDGISRYSSSDAISPAQGHKKSKQLRDFI